jgi:LSD1 subclass zinc finger protein
VWLHLFAVTPLPHLLCVCAQANQVGHLVCGSCSITLMYAHGAQSVKCAVCNHVTPVTGGAAALPAPAAAAPGPASQHPMLAVNGGGGGGGAAVGGAPAGGGSGGVTVVVENPMSLDEHGNEARSRPACPAAQRACCPRQCVQLGMRLRTLHRPATTF